MLCLLIIGSMLFVFCLQDWRIVGLRCIQLFTDQTVVAGVLGRLGAYFDKDNKC